MRLHFLSLAGRVCLLLLFAPQLVVAQDTVESTFAKCRSSLEAIETVRFTADIMNYERGVKISTATLQCTHKASRYRCEVIRRNAKGEKSIDKVSLYDGSRFQIYDTRAKRLRLSNAQQLPNPYFEMHPLLLPFLFLHQSGTTLLWNDLRNDQVWNARAAGAKVLRPVQEAGREYVVVELGSYLPGCKWTVSFDKARGYFPVKSELKGTEGLSCVILVERLHTTHPLPINVRVKQTLAGVLSESTYTIREDDLGVNQDEEDAQFTFPYTDAAYIDDVDSKKIIEVGSNKTLKEVLQNQAIRSSRWWYVAPAIVLGVFILGYAGYRRFRPSRAVA